MLDEIQKNVPLAPRTTLGVGGDAEYFISVENLEALEYAVRWANEHKHPITVLAGGSNVLVADEGVVGLVVHPHFEGVAYNDMGNSLVRVRVGAGVAFDAFIEQCVAQELWGLENLSAIPGSVGATPVQNVGAYGVEVKDSIESVTVFDCDTYATYEIKNSDCNFSYRNSCFKQDVKKKYIIIAVTFVLSKIPQPKITYKDFSLYFEHEEMPCIADIRDAIISIRSKKFPDWNIEGTAGSFFKNPLLSETEHHLLMQKYPDIPSYYSEDGRVKIALGYVLDKTCGLKGYRKGGVWLYEKQALVLVCKKGVRARDVYMFSEHIIELVFQKIHIRIECEVTFLT